MISPLSIQNQLSRWDAERSHAGRDGQKHADEEEEEEDEEELPMVSILVSLFMLVLLDNNREHEHFVYLFSYTLLSSADHTDLQFG